MLEIHLTEENQRPTITTDIDGTTRLKMSWYTGIEEALDLHSEHLSSEVKDSFRSLFRDRELQREYEKNDGTVVIRPIRSA